MIPKFLSKPRQIHKYSTFSKNNKDYNIIPVLFSVAVSVCAYAHFDHIDARITPAFVKDDENHYVHISSIRWAQKYNKCWYICAHEDGCLEPPYQFDKFVVCNPQSVDYLAGVFDTLTKKKD
jgi:hypothetical protein